MDLRWQSEVVSNQCQPRCSQSWNFSVPQFTVFKNEVLPQSEQCEAYSSTIIPLMMNLNSIQDFRKELKGKPSYKIASEQEYST